MQMGKEESRAEHARLRNGEETLRVLKECTFCYNCNRYCPHGLNPLALIITALVIFGYFFFVIRFSDREYREVIDERFGRKE